MRSINKKPQKYNIKFSQNFIRSEQLANRVMDLANFDKDQQVFEIGPGRGALTTPLVNMGLKVVAIEKDSTIFHFLRSQFANFSNVKFYNDDFLKFLLPSRGDYNVIGNIPFALTTEILKKILDNQNPPVKAVLIMQKEAALRLMGDNGTGSNENLYSLKYKPFFEFRILYNFKKDDFVPSPSVDVVLVEICKRKNPIIPAERRGEYYDFLTFCLSIWKGNLGQVLGDLFTHKQIEIIKAQNDLRLDTLPTRVEFPTWLNLFQTYLKFAPENIKQKVQLFAIRQAFIQSKVKKSHRSSNAFRRH